jgi:starvation-inducible DNA-binding protein
MRPLGAGFACFRDGDAREANCHSSWHDEDHCARLQEHVPLKELQIMAPATASTARQFRTSIDIAPEKRAGLVKHLNQSLATTSDLASQTKQAHWNVKGNDFFQLHELFDAIYAEVNGFVDDVAERIAALGGYAYGTVRMAAERSALPEYPVDAVDGSDHVAALVERYARYAAHVRASIDETDRLGDKTTADLYTEISRTIDKRLWFLEAHLQS